MILYFSLPTSNLFLTISLKTKASLSQSNNLGLRSILHDDCPKCPKYGQTSHSSLHLPDAHLDPLSVFQQLDKPGRLGVPVVIGIKDFGFESLGGIGDHFRCHRRGYVHREKSDIYVLQVFHLRDIFCIAGHINLLVTEGDDETFPMSFGVKGSSIATFMQ